MKAQTVWHVWRRILREAPLQQAVFEGTRLPATGLGLSEEEQDVANAYARTADRAKWFVVNYRYRLTNSLLNALDTGAPLTLRALLHKGLDLQALGEEFLEAQGWKDYGPYVYAYCAEVLDFLAGHEGTASPAGLRDLIGLEASVVALMRGLAPAVATPARPAAPLLHRTPQARDHRSAHRLSAWLRDKTQLGRGDLAVGVEHYLVHLPSLEGTHKLALLPARAAEVLTALHAPCTRDQLSARLVASGCAPLSARDDEHLALLRSLRAIDGVGA